MDFMPLKAKILELVSPVLEKHGHINRLDGALKYEFIDSLCDRMVSDYFSKSYDFFKKQSRLNEIEEAKRIDEARKSRITSMRNISFENFKAKIIEELNALVDERNPGKTYAIDDYSKKAFDLLLTYFHPGTRSTMNKSKGICLLGKVGTGKSTLMTAFRDNPFSSFRIVKAQDIVDAYMNDPEQTMKKILSEKPFHEEENIYGFTGYDLLIEEVGREQLNVNVKGESYKNTTINVIERILMELYDRPSLRVHIISNAETPEKLISLYGEAAASRLLEMFNPIILNPEAPNRRFN